MRLSGRHPSDCLLRNSSQRNKILVTSNGIPCSDTSIRTRGNRSSDGHARPTESNASATAARVTKTAKCLAIASLHSNRILLFIIGLLVLNADAALSQSLGQQKQLSPPTPPSPCEPKTLEDVPPDPVSDSMHHFEYILSSAVSCHEK